MRIAIFITIWTTQISPAELRDDFLERSLAFLESVPEVVSVELYLPEAGEVAVFDDGDAPALMIQIDLNSATDAEALVESDGFQRLMLDETAYAAPIDKLTADIFETVHFPLPGNESPPPRTAPLSFVVRYYGPAADGAEFARFYTENHPPILATFPGIRNVLCYLPLDWRSTKEVPDSSVILGNEVVFDNLDALNTALESDVLPRLREDGRRFAAFGYNTHHAMRRERIYDKGVD